MQTPDHYLTDLLFFFDGYPLEHALYQALFEQLDAAFPETSVRVQKSQISFYGRYLFGAVSLPVRRKKNWPEHCIVVTLGLSYRLDSLRVAVATEPYPNRWTHHILISRAEQIDGELAVALSIPRESVESYIADRIGQMQQPTPVRDEA